MTNHCPDLPWRSLIALMIALMIRAIRDVMGAIDFPPTYKEIKRGMIFQKVTPFQNQVDFDPV